MNDYTDAELDALFTRGLLCQICEERRHTQQARFHSAMICDACAAGEPTPEDAGADTEAELSYRRMLEDDEAFAERAYDNAQAETQADAAPTICDHDIF